MLNQFRIVNGTLVPADQNDSQVDVFVNPDETEVARLQRDYDVDAHTLSSALDPDEVSRLEVSTYGASIIWKRPASYWNEGEVSFGVVSVGLFLRGDRLGVVAAQDFPLAVRPPVHQQSAVDALLNLLFGTVRHYQDHLKIIKSIARELQQKIAKAMENRYLLEMFRLSESLVYYLEAIQSNGAVLNRLRSFLESNGASPEQMGAVEDLLIENKQCYRQAEIYSSVFSGLMDARGTLVNNNMNVLLKKLTIINVIFLPLNLLASVGGMSEYSMMTSGMDWRLAYPLFFVAMAILGWTTAVVLRRMDPGSDLPD